MKIVQVVPKEGFENLAAAIREKERSLRGTSTTFYQDKPGKWKHVKYHGWITWSKCGGGIIVFEIKSKVEATDWQLSSSFVGYLHRHFEEMIDSISIYYR